MYNTGEVAGLTGLSEDQIRALARQGVLGRKGKRAYGYDFPDLLLGKTAQRLLAGGARFADVCRALKAIRSRTARRIPATAVAVKTAGREVIVAEHGIAWNPATGQVQLDFDAAAQAPRRTQKVQELDASDADDWFDRGCAHEAAREFERALRAYERALTLDPAHVDARINKGRLEARRGNVAAAELDYRDVLARAPDKTIGWFNLGVLYDDAGRLNEAIDAYHRAIETDGAFPDAHFNLALLYERNDPVAAIRHLKAYQSIIDR